MTHHRVCPRCGVELGLRNPQAKGLTICRECADLMDGTGSDSMGMEESETGPLEESPSYRDAMKDAGRGRLVR